MDRAWGRTWRSDAVKKSSAKAAPFRSATAAAGQGRRHNGGRVSTWALLVPPGARTPSVRSGSVSIGQRRLSLLSSAAAKSRHWTMP